MPNANAIAPLTGQAIAKMITAVKAVNKAEAWSYSKSEYIKGWHVLIKNGVVYLWGRTDDVQTLAIADKALDFDGFIDPVNKYPTVMDFEQLAKDLIQVINNDPDKDALLFETDVETFVKKVCFDNAYDFVVENFKE